MYLFPRCCAEIACDIAGSDHVGEGAFRVAKIQYPRDQHERYQSRGNEHTRQIQRRPLTHYSPAKAIDHAHHRIEGIGKSPFFWNDRAAEAHRRNVGSELNHEWYDVTKVAIFHIECGNP